MTKSPDSRHASGDEIDLGLLLLKIIKKIKKNFKVVLSFLIFGLLCGLAYFFTSQPKYESTMVVNSKILTENNATNLLESLQELIDDKYYTLLASQLKIEDSVAEKVYEINVDALNEGEDESETKEQVFLQIAVTVSDTGILPQLEKGIINFLENNQYANRRVSLKRERFTALITETQEEINQIDSLKNKVDAGLLLQGQGANVVMMEPVNIYTASIALFEKKQDYIEQLELANSIHLVKGFIAFQKPVSPKLMINVISGMALGVFVAIIIIFFSETWIYLKKLNKQYYS